MVFLPNFSPKLIFSLSAQRLHTVVGKQRRISLICAWRRVLCAELNYLWIYSNDSFLFCLCHFCSIIITAVSKNCQTIACGDIHFESRNKMLNYHVKYRLLFWHKNCSETNCDFAEIYLCDVLEIVD